MRQREKDRHEILSHDRAREQRWAALGKTLFALMDDHVLDLRSADVDVLQVGESDQFIAYAIIRSGLDVNRLARLMELGELFGFDVAFMDRTDRGGGLRVWPRK